MARHLVSSVPVKPSPPRCLPALWLPAVWLFALGCVEITIPADAAGSGSSGLPRDPSVVPWTPDYSPDAVQVGADTADYTLADASRGDTAVILPAECATHCDCPGGWDCINTRCTLGELPILCCAGSECPSGETCWSETGVRGVCGAP